MYEFIWVRGKPFKARQRVLYWNWDWGRQPGNSVGPYEGRVIFVNEAGDVMRIELEGQMDRIVEVNKASNCDIQHKF